MEKIKIDNKNNNSNTIFNYNVYGFKSNIKRFSFN